ncbi:MAG: cation:dicarboxylase symporter family transporter, partial [Pyramidobacter sp.]|nr:cation:dicarboxylase symporter family transporter [Pyramidobacter sp.]
MTLAFILGLCLSALRGKGKGGTLYDCFQDFSLIIEMVLSSVIVPLLPLYICGTFVDMTRSGETFVVMGVLWKVFLVVIIMHLCFIV